MNETQVKCLIAAAQSGSFSEAAEKVFMTPPTFGRHISSLEQELGYPLFLRGWKRVQLTAVGELMYEGFLEIEEKLQELRREAEKISSGAVGQLTLAVLEGQNIDGRLRSVLRYFRQTFPTLQVQLSRCSFREMEERLLGGKLDLGVTLTAEIEEAEDLSYVKFQALENRIVLPLEHPMAHREELRLIDLKDTPLLELEAGECRHVSGCMRQCCINAGFQPRLERYPNLQAQLFALEAGLGMMALNENHTACANPNLVARRVEGLPPAEFCIAWHRGNPNPAIQLFLQHI